jgi:pimeloyl-ACP methyl ester carboxylesterase
MNHHLPLILLPGIGADERVFRLQAVEFPDLIVPRWIPPVPQESLPAYAKRMAAHVDPGTACAIGGLSFGGMLALEMAPHLNARACILVASVRAPGELPRRLRRMRRLSGLLSLVPTSMSSRFARLVLAGSGERMGTSTRAFLEQLQSADGPFLHWASRAVLTWQPRYQDSSVPIHHIHGDRDRVLPHRLTRPDTLVEGGGHLLTLTHPDEVNAFIRHCLEPAVPEEPAPE